jgi:hypothetical protein
MMRRVRTRTWLLLLLFITVCRSLGLPGYDDAHLRGQNKELSTRELRFPSVEDRVKLYMGNWYAPPCEDYQDGMSHFYYNTTDDWPTLILDKIHKHPILNSTQVLEVQSIIEPDTLFFLDREVALECANETSLVMKKEKLSHERKLSLESRVKFRINMRMYCADAVDSILAAFDHLQWIKGQQQQVKDSSTDQTPPLLLQFGDSRSSHKYGMVNFPHIKKFRSGVQDKDSLQRVTSKECYSSPRDVLETHHGGGQIFQPIIWKLATHRHYNLMYAVNRADTPWSKKKNKAIFRGQLTGSRYVFKKKLSSEENCRNMIRCRLVYDHGNSSLVDAMLTSTRNRLPDKINGIQILGNKTKLETQLECKAIIMIEGNDVASGLKWAMLSQSVVLMPPPKVTSWAMEELLEPWVVSVKL